MVRLQARVILRQSGLWPTCLYLAPGLGSVTHACSDAALQRLLMPPQNGTVRRVVVDHVVPPTTAFDNGDAVEIAVGYLVSS
mmetsp:Transcript_48148/g.79266  ORF Transcript_48148/g.79266 Transcript_48148/m.79266 type:complete len:82 (+) Transcript_48148:1114-1359(+)